MQVVPQQIPRNPAYKQYPGLLRPPPIVRNYRPIYHHREQGWISWIFANRFVLIIVMLILLIVVGPWLFCDVLGFNSICSIISGIFSFIAKIFNLVGL